MVTSGRSRLAAAVFVVALAVGACSSSPEVPLGPDGEPDAELVMGRDIFGGRCSTCHGTEGQGGRGARLNNGEALSRYPDAADMALVVVEGKGQAMPAFGDSLDAAQVDAVVRYIREVLN
jgi:mono/diheme cytochrome c family protein